MELLFKCAENGFFEVSLLKANETIKSENFKAIADAVSCLNDWHKLLK